MTVSSVFDAPPRSRERRVERSRRTIELFLDSVFRPWDWAATLSYHAGLQGTLRTTTATVPLLKSSGLAPLRIAFASDFHAGSTTHPRLLAAACRRLAELEPDVVLLGGDFVSVRASYIRRLAPLIAEVPARFGKFGVLGNHDLRANSRVVVSALERAGVHMLHNEHVPLPAPYHELSLCGIDDPTRGQPQAGRAMDGAEGTRIVLMHSPEGLTHIGQRDFGLALCGHTHGGQVVLPSGRPIHVPPGALNRRYHSGRFELDEADGGRTLIVSNGVGCSTIPVRLFAAPEVHLCLIV